MMALIVEDDKETLEDISLAYGAYLDNEKLGENRFFEKVTSCDNNCEQCGYCDELVKKSLS